MREEVRLDVEHVTWWETPVRPVLALIFNRPWLGRAAQAAAQGRDYKVAQHASSHVQGQATSKGKSLCPGTGEGPGPFSEKQQQHAQKEIIHTTSYQGQAPPLIVRNPGPGPPSTPSMSKPDPESYRSSACLHCSAYQGQTPQEQRESSSTCHRALSGKVPVQQCLRPGPGPSTRLSIEPGTGADDEPPDPFPGGSPITVD